MKSFLKTKEKDLEGRSFVVSQKEGPELRPGGIERDMAACP